MAAEEAGVLAVLIEVAECTVEIVEQILLMLRQREDFVYELPESVPDDEGAEVRFGKKDMLPSEPSRSRSWRFFA